VLQAVHHIFTNAIMEFYEEALSLTCDLTTTKISNNMWEMLRLIYTVFERDGIDYFVDMMPALHNYVTIDTEAFLTLGSNREFPLMLFNMSKKMLLESDPGEDPQCHAAKLLEVIILQCKDKYSIDDMIPSFLTVVLDRLQREVKTSELRTMCLQVGIAAMYYNSELFFQFLSQRPAPMGFQGSYIKYFIDKWIYDIDCFNGLHDRKLCVLGLCQLITMRDRIPELEEYAPKIFPSLIMLFEGLKRAYEQAKEDEECDDSDEDEDDEDDADQNILSSDEDEIDEESAMYLESLQDKLNKSTNGNISINASIEDDEDDSDEDDDDEFDYEETSLESFVTPLDDEDTAPDEYQIFRTVVQTLEQGNPGWYGQLTAGLTQDNVKAVQEVFKLCEQRQAAKRSKSIEQAGGYQFNQQQVPGQFNFSPNHPSNFRFGGN